MESPKKGVRALSLPVMIVLASLYVLAVPTAVIVLLAGLLWAGGQSLMGANLLVWVFGILLAAMLCLLFAITVAKVVKNWRSGAVPEWIAMLARQ
jgi:uncharacterized RDD family membrane protein YckC